MSRRTRWVLALCALAATVFALTAAFPKHSPPPSHAPAQLAAQIVRERFRLDGGPEHAFTPNARNYASRTSPTAPLLLFLPATRERPSNYTAFLGAARARGFHVLALDYWNTGRSVQRTCGANPTCYTDMQRNRLTGGRPTSFSAVDPANSIVARLSMAIGHLAQADPTGGWARFASDGRIDWKDIVVAGHSQGGGESAYIAHIHRVQGVLMFSSPVDSFGGIDASWMAHPGATSPTRMYGLDDSGDVFAERIVASWNAMGLAPSHQVVSRMQLGTPMQSHSRDITDQTPRAADGKSAFAGTWKWMLSRVWSTRDIAIS